MSIERTENIDGLLTSLGDDRNAEVDCVGEAQALLFCFDPKILDMAR